MSPSQKPKAIRRKEQIPDDVRTPGKDNAAEYIEQEVLAKDRWPMDYSQMAEECGWSRQHLRNTIRDYYVEVDSSEEEPKPGGDGLKGRTITIPDDVDSVSDYLRGVQAGLKMQD